MKHLCIIHGTMGDGPCPACKPERPRRVWSANAKKQLPRIRQMAADVRKHIQSLPK